jgi:nucleoside-diphosphate-sugar epimerase
MPRVLITGLSGFVGHHVAEGVLKHTNWSVIGLDRYHHSGTMSRIMDIDTWEEHKARVRLLWHDLRSPINPMLARDIGPVDYIFHIAASSHVDRSSTIRWRLSWTWSARNILNHMHARWAESRSISRPISVWSRSGRCL